MRTILITTALVLLTKASLSQKLVAQSLAQITKAVYDQHQPINKAILKPSSVHKVKAVIKFVTPKKTLRLMDDDEMVQYTCLADVSGTLLTLVQEEEPNTEHYYLINRVSASADTLIGEPVFATNGRDIVCLQGAETDVRPKLQVGQISNGQFQSKGFLTLRKDIYPDAVYWFDASTLLIKDSQKRYWRLVFKV